MLSFDNLIFVFHNIKTIWISQSHTSKLLSVLFLKSYNLVTYSLVSLISNKWVNWLGTVYSNRIICLFRFRLHLYIFFVRNVYFVNISWYNASTFSFFFWITNSKVLRNFALENTIGFLGLHHHTLKVDGNHYDYGYVWKTLLSWSRQRLSNLSIMNSRNLEHPILDNLLYNKQISLFENFEIYYTNYNLRILITVNYSNVDVNENIPSNSKWNSQDNNEQCLCCVNAKIQYRNFN